MRVATCSGVVSFKAVVPFCWSCHQQHWLWKSQFFLSISFPYFSFHHYFCPAVIGHIALIDAGTTGTVDMLTWRSMSWTNALASTEKMPSKWELAYFRLCTALINRWLHLHSKSRRRLSVLTLNKKAAPFATHGLSVCRVLAVRLVEARRVSTWHWLEFIYFN